MEDLTIEQWMEKYPYLKDMAEYTLFTSKDEVEQLRNSEKIKVDSKEVSIEFLKKILNNDFYFEYATRYFNNDTNKFAVAFIIGGDTGGSIYYQKSTIIKGIENLISMGQITLQSDEQQRYESLKNSISFEKFLEKHKGNNYNIDIDGNKYSIPIEQLVSLMQMPNEQFDDLCFNNNIKDINGIPKEYFIYASFKFFRESKAMEEYVMSVNVINRYKDIGTLQKVDLQAINKHLTTTDTKYQNIQIDSILEQSILAGMPENATNLEKAIYIYIKMCKTLTYDEEYYAVNQKGIATEKHKSTDYVSTITLENNKVVCFEFNLIYSKLLNQLGIHFSSEYKGMVGEAYGEGHANLEFRSDKFLVSADSVTSILQGDIMQAKINQPLVGLKCINRNQQTQQEFKDFLSKMYQLIAQQDKSISGNYQVEHIQTLDELLEEYSHVTQNIQDIGLNERLSILVNKVNSTKMIGIDALSYVLQLRKILFTEEQRNNNIGVTIVRNNEPFEEGRVAMASAIFTLNAKSFEEHPAQNIYYYFNPNHELTPISKEELQEKFNDGKLEYVEKDDPRIPGIIESGGIKK
mgnify:CR=1 FL=1